VQIAAALRAQVAAGVLLPGERVPSTRTLATQLSVSRGSVVTAYEQLTAEGYLTAEVGSGTVINPLLPHARAPLHVISTPRHAGCPGFAGPVN